jgi:acyl-CoA synthetase (AMP-forming)/AMP-acid ligase II
MRDSKFQYLCLQYAREIVPDRHQSWTQLLPNGEADWTSVSDPDNTAAAYVGTSGTSGLPKAAILSHTYMVSQAEILSRTLSVSQKVSLIPNTRSSLKIVHNCPGLTPRGPATIPRLPPPNPTQFHFVQDLRHISCHDTSRMRS